MTFAAAVRPGPSAAETDGAAADGALAALLRHLRSRDYRFVTPTPATHARVVARADRRVARDLRDMLGWSLPFARGVADPILFACLEAADMLERVRLVGTSGDLWRSRVRVSSLGGDLYLHAAYPTTQDDAVFLGPDSYRFADLIARELGAAPPRQGAHIVDIGTGAGVGAIVAARACPGARITMTDINVKALRFATINASAAGIEAQTLLGANLAQVDDPIDVALANPPYIIDDAGRDYRDGGAMHGGAVALAMARMAVARLAPSGRLILYTGSAIIAGGDPLADALGQLAEQAGCAMRYREIDPDIFGEELDAPAYADVERIAVVAAIIARPGDPA